MIRFFGDVIAIARFVIPLIGDVLSDSLPTISIADTVYVYVVPSEILVSLNELV